MQAYFAEIDKPVIIDKSRGWLAYIEMVEALLEQQAKVIVTVRPVKDILASFEKLHRETSKVRQPPGEAENYIQFQTIKGRCDYWMRDDQPVGLALNRLEDAFRRGMKNRIHLVPFNELTEQPDTVMKELYRFIGEDYFKHDFNNVEQVTQEDDEIHGYLNLHKIRKKVEPVPSRAVDILGLEIVELYTGTPTNL